MVRKYNGRSTLVYMKKKKTFAISLTADFLLPQLLHFLLAQVFHSVAYMIQEKRYKGKNRRPGGGDCCYIAVLS